MSVTDIRHGHAASDEGAARKAQELRDALGALPAEKQDAVFAQLAEVAAVFEVTGQVDPLLHFVRSLEMTARLHRNPAYRKSLAEADAAASLPPADPIDIGAFMTAARDRRAQ